ncbi:CD81 antigen isoform X1 [Seriola aureovittata]|uniref:CD81 antigen isoform X1 n=1 Tax=Seriola aureovittata TaxID=2871759 RepID=UPI0024BF0873|nr:CD81 antigen isoform X1 [Seriola aureovittata]XP_056257408.1 CD81 antigen isoform X1 [Seriola aureovittata]
MALDGCGIVCKYILILFNLIFALLGFAFLGLGLWLRFSNSTRGIFGMDIPYTETFIFGVTVLIALGSVMLIVVMFGDYGACNEKKCALQVFSALLAILAGAEMVVGVLAYSRRYEVGANIAEFYNSLYSLYISGGDPGIGVTLTFIHNMLHCCGITGISLVEVVKQTCPKPDGFMEKLVMPNCPGVITNVFDSKAPLVMGIFLGTGALLIIALICSLTLSRKICLSASSPQYIILTQSTPVLANPQPSQHEFVSTSYPDHDPVTFTPLTVANIPVAQA